MSDSGRCGCAQGSCGCCAGVDPLTPQPTANRPWLSSIAYRVGTHGAFLQTMKARLAAHRLPETDGGGQPLRALATRDPNDPAMALLDMWATVADVLTFYQERIANEGYLRTAREMRSLYEMARLVGYRPRPGVSASVYLAYTIDSNTKEEVVIQKGARVQSVPGPGELPQSFETSEPLAARASWNLLRPRTTQPQRLDKVMTRQTLYLNGITTNLKQGDPLLMVGGEAPTLLRITGVLPDPKNSRTRVEFEPWTGGKRATLEKLPEQGIESVIRDLTKRASQPLPNALQLKGSLQTSFREKNDAGYQVMGTVAPTLRETIGQAVTGIFDSKNPQQTIEVFAFRVKTGVFGRNAPKRQSIVRSDKVDAATEIHVIGEWPVIEVDPKTNIVTSVKESNRFVHLESSHEGILPNSWAVMDSSTVPAQRSASKKIVKVARVSTSPVIATVLSARSKIARAEYGASGDTTQLELGAPWLQFWYGDAALKEGDDPKLYPSLSDQAETDLDFQLIRATTVFAQSEKLELAEEPIEDSLCDGKDTPIELDGLYQDLQPGRFVVLSGERDGFGEASVVPASEALMISDVVHDVNRDLPGDRIHTFVRFDRPLSYCYRRGAVTIQGNVVKATHGETRNETLGGGDGSRALQPFTLKQAPLTYLAAPTAAGADSSLQVFVNDIRWHEAVSFVDAVPTDRLFVTKADEAGKTTVVFGNGREGARLPTGIENIKAVYRNGIGKVGNVRAQQISLLSTRPLGVREVTNPLRASGGADPESRDQVRRNAPNAVMALDRLVSTRDYADFARGFAGIAKAAAAELSDGRRSVVHVTIAGTGDIPIDPGSDLFINLRRALRDLGDPYQPVELAIRDLLILVISARIRIDPDYRWETVVTEVRARLLDALGFEQRDLGQDVAASEVLALIQSVRGVDYVDLDTLGALPSTVPDEKAEDGRRPAVPGELAIKMAGIDEKTAAAGRPVPRVQANLATHREGPAVGIDAAQLAVLVPDVPATLVLKQIP